MDENTEAQEVAEHLAQLAYVPAIRAINTAMDELELTYTAHKPIQGEGSNKVMAYQVAVATIRAILDAGYTIRLEG